MKRRFENKTALVTGASSGIGEAVAGALAAEGARVALTYHRGREKAGAVVKRIAAAGGNAAAFQLDVSDRAGIRSCIREVLGHLGGRLDVLVNCAGEWMDRTLLADCDDAIWERMIAVNLGSVFHLCREVVPGMVRQKSGAIVNVSSIVGRTGGGGGTIPYAAAKGGVNALTRGLARELAEHGVRVNGVAPGLVETPMLLRHAGGERLKAWVQSIPLKRMARPEELTTAILMLASDEASYITGEIIEVNGGLLMD